MERSMYNNIISIAYGNEKKTLKIPEYVDIELLNIKNTPKLKNPEELIHNTLKNPCQIKPLNQLVNPGDKVLIIIPDITRPIPLRQIIPPYLVELQSAGIMLKDITLLIALGTHRAMTELEIKESVGKKIYNKIRIINHDWDKPSQLMDMGITELGTPVTVNRLVFESDFVIGIGSVKPHHCAGWSGGGKIIDPGVCGSDTIGMTHWRSTDYSTNEIRGRADNPIRHEMEKVADEAGLNFITNVVLNRDDEIVYVSSGHFVAAHRECVKFAEKMYQVVIKEKADILIAGTSTWATDFWAAAILLFTAELLLKENGTVILFARCPDGISPEHPDIVKYGYQDSDKIRELVEKGVIKDLAAATQMVIVNRVIQKKKIDCILVSEGVTQEIATKVGLLYDNSTQGALGKALQKYPNKPIKMFAITGDNIADNLIIPVFN